MGNINKRFHRSACSSGIAGGGNTACKGASLRLLENQSNMVCLHKTRGLFTALNMVDERRAGLLDLPQPQGYGSATLFVLAVAAESAGRSTFCGTACRGERIKTGCRALPIGLRHHTDSASIPECRRSESASRAWLANRPFGDKTLTGVRESLMYK